MTKRLLDRNVETGVDVWFHYDELTDVSTIETVQSAEAIESILEVNKAAYADDTYRKRGLKKEFVHYASIPVGVQLKWMKEGVNIYKKEHFPAMIRRLNDPDWKYLRTAAGWLKSKVGTERWYGAWNRVKNAAKAVL